MSNSYPNASGPSREAVCTIFMTVFGMTWRGHEPTTLHVNHLAISQRFCSAIRLS